MSGYLSNHTVLVTGNGDEAHRAVAVAIAVAGADVGVAGSVKGDLSAQAALHSIANEIWALGRQSGVTDGDKLQVEGLGEVSLVLECHLP